VAGNPAIARGVCRLVLVRHAIAEGDGRLQGQLDLPLMVEGRRRLRELVRKLSRYPIRAAYSSDLCRAGACREAAARSLGVKLETRSSLREMHFSCWQGMSWRQITRRYPRLGILWIKRFPRQPIPGAERFDDFVRCVRREMRILVIANQGRCVLAVRHAGVIRVDWH
jgi:broad specificity phosphatase PhoE